MDKIKELESKITELTQQLIIKQAESNRLKEELVALLETYKDSIPELQEIPKVLESNNVTLINEMKEKLEIKAQLLADLAEAQYKELQETLDVLD